jgi:antitoxin (DNA-binding transcriptional repressor) of toxin-antitoxin stability system
VVTDHGRPVARIIPEALSLSERVEALRKAGAIAWSGRRLRPAKPAGKVRGTKTVADLLVEDRE